MLVIIIAMQRRSLIIWLCLFATSAIFFFITMGILNSRQQWDTAEDLEAATDTLRHMSTISCEYYHIPDDNILNTAEASDIPIDTLRDMSANIHSHSGPLRIEGESSWRVSFGYGPGASVRGWPSKGGVLSLDDCLSVELEFLGLDRFKEVKRPQKTPSAEADEEAHCKRMRQLGATWWPSDHDESMWWLLNPEQSWPHEKPVAYFGWPAKGGVWALNMTLISAGQMGAGKIYGATTMEERCKILEDLGAVHYANPEDCPFLDLSGEREVVPDTPGNTCGAPDSL
jgi:hypothetical protein